MDNLKEHPQIVELLDTLDKNGLMKEKNEVKSLINYIGDMEETLTGMLGELQDMRREINLIHNNTLRNKCHTLVEKTEGKIRQGFSAVKKMKDNLIQSAGNAVRAFREKGRDALAESVRAMKIPEALDKLSSMFGRMSREMAQDIIIDPEREYSQLVKALGGEVIHISATSQNHINAMDMTKEYGDGANPVILKSEFIMSLCEQLIGGSNLGAKQKSIIDRCTASVYRTYQQNNYQGEVPTLQDFRAELLKQDEPEAQEIALAIELFTNGSLNTFAKHTNVDTNNRLICYDILDLGKQLMPIGMLVVLDSILNRITQNRAKGRNTFIFIDEIYLLFQHEYSANFLFTLWKRVRKYGAYATGITQNVDDLLQSHTARTMLANSEFIIMLNQASTDKFELAKLLNISDLQMSYITNVEAGHGLIKVGSALVPFANKFPKNTKLYKLMTTKPGESA